jgi:hypothetical protein
VRRPSLTDVRRATDQFLRAELAARGVGDAEFGRLEAELAARKAKDGMPRLVQNGKGRFRTTDGAYRIVRTNASYWTVSKLKNGGKYAKVAEAKTLHLCWELVQRLIVLSDLSAA